MDIAQYFIARKPFTAFVGGVHDRMPVMLLPVDYDTWLGPNKSPDELRALLRPYDANLMEAYAVSCVVNSVKNDTEECIEPINDEDALRRAELK